MKGISLFSSAGIDEYYLNQIGFDIVVANELIKKRGDLYSFLYPKCNMIIGDINSDKVFNQLKVHADKQKIDFIIATPPCQGVSLAGKNKNNNQMIKDDRNYLIFKAIELIKIVKPKFILIENVVRFNKLFLPYKGTLSSVFDILTKEFPSYSVDMHEFDASDYSIPQKRKRIIYRIYDKSISWQLPKKSKLVTVRDAISHLPSLESGERSNIRWHFARKHDNRHVNWMKHTPEGCSAFDNDQHFPVNNMGHRIKGYRATYSRMKWDAPAPTITMRNDAISSQSNVHPGRKKQDGTYSDARVLSILELLILTSLPEDINLPESISENLIRQCIGESFPPLLLKKILQKIHFNS